MLPQRPRATDAPEATVEPEPTLDASLENAGVVTFGKSFDPDTLEISRPIKKFKRKTNSIAWSAQFSEAAGATSIRRVLARVSKGGSETIIDSADIEVSSPDNDLFASKGDLAGMADNKAGTYVVRYLRDDTVLADGTFQLVN